MALEQWEEEAWEAYLKLSPEKRELAGQFYNRTEPLTREGYTRTYARAMRDAGLFPEKPAPMVGAEEYEEVMQAVEIFEEVEGGGLEAQVDGRV